MPERININKLGSFLDGWAELIEGKGAKAEKVREEVLKLLQSREMPDVETANKEGYVTEAYGSRREYVITSTFPGVTTAIYIAQHGKDLYASWRSYMRLILNTQLLIILGGISFMFGFIYMANNPSSGGLSLFGSWIGGFVLLCVLVGAAGYAIKNNVLTYFFVEPNYFDIDDVTAMNLSVHYSVLRALDKAGIDSAKLRLKQDFKAGRRENVM
jgi:hypothetical protein